MEELLRRSRRVEGDRLVEEVARRLEEAYREAGRHGTVVGRVSRFSEVRVSEGARVEFEVDPEVYYSRPGAPYHRVGDYLAVLDPKTGKLILARVSEIVRRDELAYLGVDPPLSGYPASTDPAGLVTRTSVVGELVVEADPRSWRVEPAVTSVEPQSPIIDLKPEVLARLLELPERGVPLGALATPGGLVKGGSVAVRLSARLFYQHILVVGTTGAGKTTLLKNMIASMYSDPRVDERPVAVVADMNQDFIQLPLPPSAPPRGSPEELVASNVYRGVKPPRGIAVVVPLTWADFREALDSGARDPAGLARAIARAYVDHAVAPLAPEGRPVVVPKLVEGVGGSKALGAEVRGLPFTLHFYAYTVNTRVMGTDALLGLMPGLTPHAMDLLRKLRKRVRESMGEPGPLQALYAALRAVLEVSQGRRLDFDEADAMEAAEEAVQPYVITAGARGWGDAFTRAPLVLDPDGGGGQPLASYVEAYLDAVREARPHRGTLEALYRRVTSLLDTGSVDPIVDLGGALWTPGEPPWPRIVSDAHRARVPVVLDLKWAGDRGEASLEAPRMAAYRMLGSLIEWKHRVWASRGRERAPNVVVFIDEAHQFFPQEKGDPEEREASRQVAGMIAKIARLGRARGVGLVFSTHSPKDLHEIVVQLANTKIVLRSERGVAEQLGVPPELRGVVPRLPDRRLIVMSHAFKEGYVIAHTSTPLTGHFDIPSTIT